MASSRRGGQDRADPPGGQDRPAGGGGWWPLRRPSRRPAANHGVRPRPGQRRPGRGGGRARGRGRPVRPGGRPAGGARRVGRAAAQVLIAELGIDPGRWSPGPVRTRVKGRPAPQGQGHHRPRQPGAGPAAGRPGGPLPGSGSRLLPGPHRHRGPASATTAANSKPSAPRSPSSPPPDQGPPARPPLGPGSAALRRVLPPAHPPSIFRSGHVGVGGPASCADMLRP
jgi:hypothetical protein